MFAALDRSGSSTERATEGIAASWNTTLAPAHARASSDASRMLPSIRSISSFAAARLPGLPVEKSSMARTRYPRRTSSSVRWDPMKPAPPVTTTVVTFM